MKKLCRLSFLSMIRHVLLFIRAASLIVPFGNSEQNKYAAWDLQVIRGVPGFANAVIWLDCLWSGLCADASQFAKIFFGLLYWGSEAIYHFVSIFSCLLFAQKEARKAFLMMENAFLWVCKLLKTLVLPHKYKKALWNLCVAGLWWLRRWTCFSLISNKNISTLHGEHYQNKFCRYI